MRWLYCVVLSIGVSGTAFAEAQFWVAVGSYRDAVFAEEARLRADAALRETFTVSITDIESERWYRVITGPYLTRGIAELTLVEAQQAGFDGTWMLVTESSDFTDGGYEDYEDEYGPLPDYESLDSSASDSYPDIDSLLPTSSNSGEERATRIPREVVGSAPAGYGLHKLRRDGD